MSTCHHLPHTHRRSLARTYENSSGAQEPVLRFFRHQLRHRGPVKARIMTSDTPAQGGPPSPPAGWYADPQGPGQQRWWDGNGWTDHRAGFPVYSNVTMAPALTLQLPAGVYLTSVGKKFGVYVLEGLLFVFTLGIGWLIWGAVTAAHGQTPARQVLGVYLVSAHTGRPLSWPEIVFVRGIIGAAIMSLAAMFTLGILLLMPLWDAKNQTVADKISQAIAVDAPNGAF